MNNSGLKYLPIIGKLQERRLNMVINVYLRIANVALIRTHGTDGCETGRRRRPAVHKAQAVVSPFAAVIGIAVTGIGDEIYFVGFFCGKCRRSHAAQRGNAHQHCQKQRQRSFEFLRFH